MSNQKFHITVLLLIMVCVQISTIAWRQDRRKYESYRHTYVLSL